MCPPSASRRESEAIATCYKLLPTVHRLYRRVPGEEDDYIAQPKVGFDEGRSASLGAALLVCSSPYC